MELTGSMIVNFFIIFLVIPAIIISFFHLRKVNKELDSRIRKASDAEAESRKDSEISRKDNQNFATSYSFRHGLNTARKSPRPKSGSAYGIKKRETLSYGHRS